MADVEERLSSWIFDENKVVTAKWLSSKLDVSVAEAKAALARFLAGADNERGGLSAVLCEVTTNEGPSQQQQRQKVRLRLVVNDVGAVPSHSLHSVQASRPKDSTVLQLANACIQRHSPPAIACPHLTKLAGHEGPPDSVSTENPVAESKSAATTTTTTTSNPTTSTRPGTSAKGSKNSIATLLTRQQKNPQKAVTSETSGPSKNKKSSTSNGCSTDEKCKNKKSSTSNGCSTDEKCKNEKKRKPGVLNPPKLRKRIKVFADDSSESDASDGSSEDPLPSSRRQPSSRKIRSDDEDEEASKNDDGNNSQELFTVKDSEPLEPEVKTVHSSRHHKWVNKQFLDEEGYLVTKKVMEVVEQEEEEEEKVCKPAPPPPPAAAAAGNNKDKGAVDRKTIAKKKDKCDKTQSSLMSFFTRK